MQNHLLVSDNKFSMLQIYNAQIFLQGIKVWNNLHSSSFSLVLHLQILLHKFQAILSGRIILLSPFSVFHLPYDILEDGVRDLIQCSTLHHSTWHGGECSSNIVSINLISLASTWQFQQPGVKGHRLFNWCQRSLSHLYSKLLRSFPPKRELLIKLLKERPSLRRLYIQSSVAHLVSELIWKVGWNSLFSSLKFWDNFEILK